MVKRPAPDNGFTTSASCQSAFTTEPRDNDPYIYQVGFGNHFSSEVIPGALPQGINAPKRVKYDLYSEQINGTPFFSSRATVQHAWFYRVFPSAAHGDVRKLALNPDVSTTITTTSTITNSSDSSCSGTSRKGNTLSSTLTTEQMEKSLPPMSNLLFRRNQSFGRRMLLRKGQGSCEGNNNNGNNNGQALTPSNSPSQIESRFTSSNENVEFVPQPLCWLPFPIPSATSSTSNLSSSVSIGNANGNGAIDFVDGLKTICGHGDPTAQEGVAVHVYAANASMRSRAFCSNDGDMLLVPQVGRLDVQTEMGRLMVRPEEIAVIQAGIRFRVSLPDGPARGYVQEVFGSHYELPELGPLGANGMAQPQDFQFPVASFDMDTSNWEVVYKLAGKLWSCTQNHTPFDVIAWHGNYVPYKYDSAKFIPVAVVDRDQSDPSVFTVLTAKSKTPGVAATEVMIFVPKWNVAMNSFRPPYYHRNVATEILGLIYGEFKGSSRDLRPGGLSFQSSYMPHGETHETFVRATTAEQKPERAGDGYLGFMFHISAHCAITKYGLERSGVLNPPPSTIWDSMKGHFFEHIDEVNEDLKSRGLNPITRTRSNSRRKAP